MRKRAFKEVSNISTLITAQKSKKVTITVMGDKIGTDQAPPNITEIDGLDIHNHISYKAIKSNPDEADIVIGFEVNIESSISIVSELDMISNSIILKIYGIGNSMLLTSNGRFCIEVMPVKELGVIEHFDLVASHKIPCVLYLGAMNWIYHKNSS